MSYLVIARKYRPMRFDDVIGQEHITTTLKNAIESGRIAHAYIFSGPRGVGKTTTARIFAKAINCEKGGPTVTPCNECLSCTEITGGRSLDVLEIDGASNRGIDEIRSLRDNVRYMPIRGGYKIYIIDEFHMITKDAFNALLKTLEEPPPQVIFIFATTEPNKILPTILSRCQRFDFKRVPIDKIIGRLRYICNEEKITIDEESLFAMAQMSDGGMRDSLTLLDQVISFCGTDIKIDQLRDALGIINVDVYFELTNIIHQKQTAEGFKFAAKILDAGWDITEFLHGFLEHIRNMLMAKACGAQSLTEVFEGYQKQYGQSVAYFSEPDLLRMMNLVSETVQRVKWSIKQKFIFELMLMKLIHMESTVQVSDLIRKIESIENNESNSDELVVKKKINSVAPAASEDVPEPTVLNSTASIPVVKPAKFSSGSQHVTVSLRQVESKWGAILSRVKLEKIRVGAILENAFPAEIVQDVLHVGFTHSDFTGFHIEIIHKEREYLSNVMNEFLGQRVRIQCDLKRTIEIDRDHRGLHVNDMPEDHYPAVESMDKEETKSENGASQKDRVELFKHIRELEQKDPLKRLIEMFDCELIEASYKSNT
ncbi:DNA polymerase III subunit gamma/tau [bacterium]|nr:DNA polymerase III subunit gamma/tau [bacterium]